MKQIGICGTFDVENYGDLLFPLIAEKELTARLGPVRLRPFSYFAKTPPGWPYEVTSLLELPDAAGDLDGLILGGGDLVRFDKLVAPGYGPPTPDLHHPTGYWLAPALIALQREVPVVWNAPGVYGPVPVWAEPLLETAIRLSSYVAVRDERSWRALTRFAGGTEIAVVPDTAFGVSRLLDPQGPTPEFTRLRSAADLSGSYIVVQATGGLEGFVHLLRERPAALDGHRIVAVPIGPVLGDDAASFARALPEAVLLPAWPPPLVLAELIAGAEAVVGISLHLAITALACGVPAFRPDRMVDGKYAMLSGFDTIHTFDGDLAGSDPGWFTARAGRVAPSPAVRAANDRLSRHWDRVASVLEGGHVQGVARALGRVWQAMPGLLDGWAARQEERERALAAERETARQQSVEREAVIRERDAAIAERTVLAEHTAVLAERDAARAANADSTAVITERNARITHLDHALAEARLQIADRDRCIAALHDSTSWKITAPLRSLRGRLPRWPARRVIRLDRIEGQTLATEPYGWAFVGSVFSRGHAAALSRDFPRDHFKTVTGYDGEKGYEYEARSLVGMAAEAPSHAAELTPVWRRFAADLLSPAYRAALMQLTGIDLAAAPMEVNVFHYGPGAWLGPHLDLRDKIVTHVFYFNRAWNEVDGGCLTILRSSDMADAARVIAPVIGGSAVLVRSEKSWHAVSRVVAGCRQSRRSMTVTFYRPGSVSTLWPPGDETPLHSYEP